MPIIKSSSIRELKTRINIHDVVSPVVALKKAGANYKGLSPFNQEKTPSFFISPDKGLYKCFSSGKAGDIISFLMETERLTFAEAVETLSRRFNVPIEYEEGGPRPEDRSLRQELFELHEYAADHYHRLFLSPSSLGKFVRSYWTGPRRFPIELAEEFRVGAAPADGCELAGLLLKKGFTPEALRQSGLFYVRGERPADFAFRPRFRGRLMIPIRDTQSRVIAFTARQLEITPADDPSREAKYVNSPETPLFIKGQVLFNLDQARLHASEAVPFLLVEGQIDALRCWQVGLRQAVAPQGTAITEQQLLLLRRYSGKIECLLDGDEAGQRAAFRFLPLSMKVGLETAFLVLPAGSDPDSLLAANGAAALEQLREGALSAMAFASRQLLPESEGASPEQKSRAVLALCEIVAASESEVARTEYLSELAELLHLPPAAVEHDFRAFLARKSRQSSFRSGPAEAPAPPPTPGRSRPEDDLLLLCLHFETLGKPLAGVLNPEWVDSTHISGRLLNRFLAEFQEDAWPGRDHLEALLEAAEEKELVSSVLFENPPFDDPLKVANEGLRALHLRFLQPQIDQIKLEIARKGTNGEDDIVFLHRKLQELNRMTHSPPKIII